MNPRVELVNELRSELLGPRNNDPYEKLGQDPRSEYVTGVLEPSTYIRSPLHFYSSVDFRVETDNQLDPDDDSTENEYDQMTGIGSLDPRALPKSIGISFVVPKGLEILSDILCTWARYLKKDQEWIRHPDYLLLKNIDLTKESEHYKDQVRILIKSRNLNSNNIFVSIYLVNNTELEDKLYCPIESLIFQPQIRIQKKGKYNFIQIRSEQLDDEEDAKLTLIYKDKTPLARGHMCGSVWKEIDPEYVWGLNDELRSKIKNSPFVFIDKEILSEDDKKYFIKADIRTEFIPMFSIEQVKYGPLENKYNIPFYEADLLSKTYEKEDLLKILSPIVSNYRLWIEDTKNKIIHKNKYGVISEKLMDHCIKSLNRVLRGINYLIENDNSRLAFCFMNKVMDTQSIWKRNKPLEWRLFQISFILQNIVGISENTDKEREICDILWFPTGGGKTEAYLGLMIFTIALRRLKNRKSNKGNGTGVISRYTLRMLTLQQYRRTLYAILAAELLRNENWSPNAVKIKNLWGTQRFALGLWIGGGVTPNYLLDHKRFNKRYYKWDYFPGALGKLQGPEKYEQLGHRVIEFTDTEPAQIMTCPACESILAIPEKEALPEGIYSITWIIKSKKSLSLNKSINNVNFSVLKDGIKIDRLQSEKYFAVRVKFKSIGDFSADHIDRWWKNVVKPSFSTRVTEAFSRASRPGYFIKKWGVHQESVDFEIHCTDMNCILNKSSWSETIYGVDGSEWATEPLEPFRTGYGSESFSIPIPAYTVDEQVYHRCPSVIIATVDKFARLPYEPKTASIFGNVNAYDSVWGFFREEIPPDRGDLEEGEIIQIEPFDKPDLIIQDEMHLIEGPLGSMVGIYETLINSLCSTQLQDKLISPKYIASSATLQKAIPHATSVFSRTEVDVFPAIGLSIDDNFFSSSTEKHPLDSSPPGRLYLGVCAPGRGPHTPTIRIWSTLLRKSYELGIQSNPNDPEIDNFNTIVGYFNAIKELAQVNTLYNIDIRDRLDQIGCKRPLDPPLELSSQMDSAAIPSTLEKLGQHPNNAVDAALATSMFGTGIDVDRLGLMVVHGQPKTTANYIQATGRVGRNKGGLVITFYRSTRPRDLDHYEFFIGYHRSLHRFVEPITANPFSPRARERTLGPIIVGFLRNAQEINGVKIHRQWAFEETFSRNTRESGSRLIKSRYNSNEIKAIKNVIILRSQDQPDIRKPDKLKVFNELDNHIIKWKDTANIYPNLVYYESAMLREPEYPVVLGDPQHTMHELPEVYENAPNSLREVEAGARFEV